MEMLERLEKLEVENARLSQELNRTKDQLHKVIESKENYKIIIDNISDLVALINPQGLLQYVSPSHEKALGYPIEELMNMEPALFLHPEDHDRFIAIAIELLQTNGTVETIVRLIRKDGGVLWLDAVFVSVLNSDGQLRSILCRGRDITDRQVVEQALVESEERYRSLIQLCPLPIEIHKDDIITFVNYASLKLLGAENEQIIGRLISDFIHPEDMKRLGEESISSDQTIECRLLDLKRNVLDIDARGVRLQDGSSLYIIQDVTTRKKVEAVIKDSEQYYRRLVELSPLAIGTHLDGELIYLNPAGLALLGEESLDDVLGRSIYDVMPPESVQRALNYRYHVVHNHKQPPLEIEIYSKRGEKIHVELVSSYDEHTQMIQFMMNNITEQTRNKIALRNSEERYYLLQNSLDRFSKDVFGIISISGLEKRLVTEVQNILETEFVTIVEWDTEFGSSTREGNHRLSNIQEECILQLNPDQMIQNELLSIDQDWIIKIGESYGKHVLLYIGKTNNLNYNAQHVWLRTLTRYVNVLYDNFHVIEELSIELKDFVSTPTAPPWLLRIFFNISENERKRLSQDLHDSALQEQIVWYRRLEMLNLSSEFSSDMKHKISEIMEGLLDVIYQIRVTCSELRPPLLKEMGLVSSLRSLFDTTQMRSDFLINFKSELVNDDFGDELTMSIYRIIQELLTNAAKHSQAKITKFKLLSSKGNIILEYEDNGIGMEGEIQDKSFRNMGMYGIRERVRSMEGTVQFESHRNAGLKVWISIPRVSNGVHNHIE